MSATPQIHPEDCADTPAARLLAQSDAALLTQCQVDTYRASGPGGQKRNKTASAVRLRHQPSGLSAIGVESRSQHENKARALRRLRATIALTLRGEFDAGTYTPSRLLRGCISAANRLSVGQKDYRYQHVVSEILDLLVAVELRVSTAAELLKLSTANLTSFITKDLALKAQVNRMRAQVSLKPLR